MSPLFGRQGPSGPTDEERRAAEVDLERIRQGGIPLGAENRLKRISTASTPFFTSDLSAKEYALAQASGLRPVALVMGSSVVQHGWTGNQVGGYWGSAEVRGLSDPWNLARTRAFDRLRQEAELAGADGVLGIELTRGALEGGGQVEYVVFGTAVRDEAIPRRHDERLGLCTLSGQEVDELRRIGARVRTVVGHTTVVSVQLSMDSNYMLNSSGWLGRSGNAEIRELSQGVYDARARVMAEARHQAGAAGANNIVISELRHSIAHREYDGGGGKINYFYVTMHLLGTAIQLGAHKPHPAPLTGPMLLINLGH
jgi:uncharacterized protein YbjQ (UPF0145 family)